MLGLESTLRRKRDRVRKCTIWYVRARDRIIRWVRARKHTPKKMDKYAFFLVMFFDYAFYNVFLGYSPNSFFFPNLKKKKTKIVLFWTTLFSSFPCTRRDKWRNVLFLYNAHFTLSLYLQKTKRTDMTHAPHLSRKKKNRADKPYIWLPKGRTDTPYPCAMTGQG